MILHRWQVIEYRKARKRMQEIHTIACRDGQNHLILCSHPTVFTIGSDTKEFFDVPTVLTDRGGSISCHSFGQNIYYFCFHVKQPARFYKKVLQAFESFFMTYLCDVHYDKKKPGFYRENRKIASLGFRYAHGVSLHGVSLNIDVDLAIHSKVPPCNLEGIVPTSLHNEGVYLSHEEVDSAVLKVIMEHFNESLQA